MIYGNDIIQFLTASELTIATDAITITQGNHKLQPQTGTTDNLATINGTSDGEFGVLYVSDFGTDTITVKHNTGNILCVTGMDIPFSYGCLFWYSNGTKVFVSGMGNDVVTTTGTQILTNKTLTTPQINDTSSDHQYVFVASELTADRNVTLPLLTGNDVFVFADFIQTLTNKTLTSPVLTTPQINDTSLDHQYVFVASELTADRNVTLPLLTGADTFVFQAHTQTLTNKRVTKRVASTTDDATAVIDSDSYDEYYLTAVANATEISVTGTPTAGQTIFIGLKDAGVSKALTWTGITALGATLPTATTAGKQHIIGIKYIASAWRAIAVAVEA